MTDTDDGTIIRRAFSGSWRFSGAAGTLERLLPANKIEVAFAGRSNAGKSSLINCLTHQASLARTSHTPGRTQEIIFFDSPNLPELRLVDLPGYGYAKVAKTLKHSWGQLIMDYLVGRPNLRRVYLLIDSRRGLTKVDFDVIKALDTAGVSYQAVFTKSDKLVKADLAPLIDKTMATLRLHPAAHPEIIVTSSRNNIGTERLQSELVTLAKTGPIK